jgi:hypothetical protein
VGWIAPHFFRCPEGAPFLVRRAEGPSCHVEAGRVTMDCTSVISNRD